VTTPKTPPEDAPRTLSRGRRALAVGIGAALVAVIIAPIALSSQDLVKWGADPAGLGLSQTWAWLVFVALDLAAAVCVGMVTFSAYRGESAGIFHVLTWLFAGVSAFANYRHGLAVPARDAKIFFPLMSLLGPLLLETVLHRIRKWARAELRTAMTARPSFGWRWLPGVAFRETLAAWAAARRENIGRPEDAIALVREIRWLGQMTDADAIRYAWSALGTDHDEYQMRLWLQSRGRTVAQSAIDDAAGRAPRRKAITPPPPPPPPLPPGRPVTVPLAELSQSDAIRHAITATGSSDPGEIVAWLEGQGLPIARQRVCDVQRRDRESGRHRLASVPSQRATG
jgi:hypothetical protein